MLAGTLAPPPTAGTHKNSYEWASLPYDQWDFYVRYRLSTTWPGGDNGTQALMISHGRWQWNELPGQLHYAWAPAGQANRRIDVTYENLMFPATGWWAMMTVQTFTADLKMYDVNIAFNDSPDGWPKDTFWWWSSSTSVPKNRVDAISVAVHEFGHAVALNHTTSTADVMYQTLNAGTHRRPLSSHDTSSVLSMYWP